MTTESTQPGRPSGASVLLGAAFWGFATAVVTVLVAFAAKGGQAGLGALIGGVTTLAVLGVGTWVVLRVATVSPLASLLAALVVFTAQGGLLLITLAVLSEVAGETQVTWAAAAVIVVTVVLTTLFAVYARKERIPLFDLSGVSAR